MLEDGPARLHWKNGKRRFLHEFLSPTIASLADNPRYLSPKKMKTVSGKVSRGGSHDTNGRRPFVSKNISGPYKSQPLRIKKDVGAKDDSRNLTIPFPVYYTISYGGILSTYKVTYVLGSQTTQ